MSQALCHLIVEKLLDSDELGELALVIESGQGIWQLMMDHPTVFGMFLGGICVTLIRQYFWGDKRRK